MAKRTIKRRMFLGAGFVGLGGILGWFGQKISSPSSTINQSKKSSTAKLAIDLDEFQVIDPELMLYEFSSSFQTGMEVTKRLALDSNESIFVIGDKQLKVFSKNGETELELNFEQIPHCIHVFDDQIYIGFSNYYQLYTRGGELKLESPKLGEKTFLTSITIFEDRVFLADAGNREIIICDQQGQLISRFGKKNEQNPGFVVPSPYFDLTISAQGYLLVNNPGRMRVETYSLDGIYQSSWGEPGMKPGKFCGCCNPVFFDLLPNGQFVTSEKGLSRISIFNPDGSLKGMVAGHAELIQDKVKAKKARKHFQKGICFDLAAGVQDRIYVVDPVMNEIRTFELKPT